jgi:hypothetical protein
VILPVNNGNESRGESLVADNNDNNSIVGSGGIIVDHWHEPPRLVVAEWGEGRIARLEENGARTPLVIEYHDQDQEETP